MGDAEQVSALVLKTEGSSLWLPRCCCGAAACLGFLGAHAASFREALAEARGGGKVWRDLHDGLNYPVFLQVSKMTYLSRQCMWCRLKMLLLQTTCQLLAQMMNLAHMQASSLRCITEAGVATTK